MRKVFVNVTVRLIIDLGESEIVDEVIQEMDYNFTASDDQNAFILDTEIRDFEIIDSK